MAVNYRTFRLSEQAQRQIEKGSTKFEDLNLGDMRPTQLIRRYGNLYSEGRLDALDSLDDIPEMSNFDDLKGKLLLTILVVSILNSDFKIILRCHCQTTVEFVLLIIKEI
jgi:Mitochondria-eating protein